MLEGLIQHTPKALRSIAEYCLLCDTALNIAVCVYIMYIYIYIYIYICIYIYIHTHRLPRHGPSHKPGICDFLLSNIVNRPSNTTTTILVVFLRVPVLILGM